MKQHLVDFTSVEISIGEDEEVREGCERRTWNVDFEDVGGRRLDPIEERG